MSRIPQNHRKSGLLASEEGATRRFSGDPDGVSVWEKEEMPV
jgi:hypothetical protein